MSVVVCCLLKIEWTWFQGLWWNESYRGGRNLSRRLTLNAHIFFIYAFNVYQIFYSYDAWEVARVFRFLVAPLPVLFEVLFPADVEVDADVGSAPFSTGSLGEPWAI